jgi:DNA-binding PadR family transcriptional regulator
MGHTSTQVFRLTSVPQDRVIWALAKLTADGLLTEQLECGPNRTIRRYKLTKAGQRIVDQMVDMDIVHERIIDILYGRRLLKH